MNRKPILKILSKSGEYGRAVVLTSKQQEFDVLQSHCAIELKTNRSPLFNPQNHPTMTKMNRLYILCKEQLS